MKTLFGFHPSFKKKDLKTGFPMPETGVSQEADTGAIQSQFGLQTTCKKLSVLDQSPNCVSSQVAVH